MLVLLIGSSTISFANRELYVVSAKHCSRDHHCNTLQSYLESGTTTFTSNTTIRFGPGTHYAASPRPTTLLISNVSNLLLIGPHVGPDDIPLASIHCNYTLQFRIEHAYNVSVRMLERSTGVELTPVFISLSYWPKPLLLPSTTLIQFL